MNVKTLILVAAVVCLGLGLEKCTIYHVQNPSVCLECLKGFYLETGLCKECTDLTLFYQECRESFPAVDDVTSAQEIVSAEATEGSEPTVILSQVPQIIQGDVLTIQSTTTQQNTSQSQNLNVEGQGSVILTTLEPSTQAQPVQQSSLSIEVVQASTDQVGSLTVIDNSSTTSEIIVQSVQTAAPGQPPIQFEVSSGEEVIEVETTDQAVVEQVTTAIPTSSQTSPTVSPLGSTTSLTALLFSLLPPHCKEFTVAPFLQCTKCSDGYELTQSRTCQEQTVSTSSPSTSPVTIPVDSFTSQIVQQEMFASPQTSSPTTYAQPAIEPSATISQPDTDPVQSIESPQTQPASQPSTEPEAPQSDNSLAQPTSEQVPQEHDYGMPRRQFIDDLNCVTKNLLFSFELPISKVNVRCSLCFAGYYYDLRDEICKPVNYLCRTHEQNRCLSCFRGYRLEGTECISGHSESSPSLVTRSSEREVPENSGWKDPNCRSFYEGTEQCQECYDHHYVHPQMGRCVQVHPSCATWDPQTGYCLTCYEGYACGPTDRQCYPIKATVSVMLHGQDNSQKDNCLRKINGVCVSCVWRYYLQLGECLKVSDDCHTFDPYDGDCLTCYPGYNLTDGRCEAPLKSPDPFCSIYTSIGCELCIINYYVDLEDGRKCKGVSPLCQGYNPINGHCRGCLYPFTLDDGECVYLPF